MGEHVTDGTMTDSRPGTRDGPDVNVMPPTPPNDTEDMSTGVERDVGEDADDEEDMVDPRELRSGPATPTGTRNRERDDIDSPPDLSDGVGLEM